ncbi:MAG: peptidyl-prolyl cis-trans isomerase [Myxococcota bacterium]|nr:peptidyl-prolyl cis-trans isomerase [Myxococcota bacterium]
MRESDRRSPLLLVCGLALCLSLSSCVERGKQGTARRSAEQRRSSDVDDGPILATVAGEQISAGDLQRHLDSLTPFTRSRYQSPARRAELLDTLIRFELLAQEAERLGLDQRPDVRLAHKQQMVRQLIREVLPAQSPKLEEINDAQLREYYDAHRDEYERAEQARAAHILLESEAEASALLLKIQRRVEEKPRDARRIFAEAARAESKDLESQKRDGDLQYFSRPGTPAPARRLPQTPPPEVLIEATFALPEVGAIHPMPIESSRGWHLLQKTGYRQPLKRDFESVKVSLRNQLYRSEKRAAMERFVKDLRVRAEVKIDEEALQRIRPPKRAPGAAPQVTTTPAQLFNVLGGQ